ncbi:rRNA maturation RNase YbeY [Anaeromicropila populeti]|uniref:Endoribonuclease YbeY n=1 Tax=Anaeromicropila populeti TaxID=37658 RepID=A0A1I6KYC6_9FIRM|nr:rRNA maturation RNase YbeY [Anaeromicropila populeti]SFR96204.1 probable rRNA maturation factor [Anaeromicropila populeti]
MNINIENEYTEEITFPYEELVEKVVNQALQYEACPYEVELNVLLTDNEGIHQINLETREIDKETDVLSFPMVDYEQASDFSSLEEHELEYFNPETGELLLGDIVVSIDKVYEQADLYGHSEKREFCFLIAHSMLHLFGYDHMGDSERMKMEKKQEEILKLLNILRNGD